MGQAMALSRCCSTLPGRRHAGGAAPGTPIGPYYARGRPVIAASCLQAGKYWPELCEIVERPELATDPRFADHEPLMAHAKEAAAVLNEVFARPRSPSGASASSRSSASGRWCRTRSRPRRPADGGERLPAGGRPRRYAVHAGGRPGPVRRPTGSATAGTRVQRARRGDPPRPRPRLGRHHRPPREESSRGTTSTTTRSTSRSTPTRIPSGGGCATRRRSTTTTSTTSTR